MRVRERVEIGPVSHPCTLCGGDAVVLVRSRDRRVGMQLFSPRFDGHERLTEVCHACGARERIEAGGMSLRS